MMLETRLRPIPTGSMISACLLAASSTFIILPPPLTELAYAARLPNPSAESVSFLASLEYMSALDTDQSLKDDTVVVVDEPTSVTQEGETCHSKSDLEEGLRLSDKHDPSVSLPSRIETFPPKASREERLRHLQIRDKRKRRLLMLVLGTWVLVLLLAVALGLLLGLK